MATRLIILLCLFGASFRALGGDRVFESGPTRAHLIELFTSEGCSSCPPAESWLSKLKNEPGLWKNFVPLAFHVDYWDHLGWKDPFASKEWTKRQSEYWAGWGGDSVYTPGFVLDGREWRGLTTPEVANEKPGMLKLSLMDKKATAEFHPTNSSSDKDLELHLAWLGDGVSKVTAGENKGRELHHDFVVLALSRKKLEQGRADFEYDGSGQSIAAIAAWITAPNRIEPIQAVGGWVR